LHSTFLLFCSFGLSRGSNKVFYSFFALLGSVVGAKKYFLAHCTRTVMILQGCPNRDCLHKGYCTVYLASFFCVLLMESSSTVEHDDVVDVTSWSALDVVEINMCPVHGRSAL
jgi:hypothetical protein